MTAAGARVAAATPVLLTPRLRLRRLGPDDLPALLAVFRDPAVVRYWSRPALQGPGEAQALLDDIDAGWADGSLNQWGVALRGDDAVIGTATLFGFQADHQRAEIGYAIASRYWRRGYAREAVGAVLAHGFGALGLHRIEADVDPRNAASLALLDTFGFRREGLLLERYLVDGERQDAALLGLLRTEWAARLQGRLQPR